MTKITPEIVSDSLEKSTLKLIATGQLVDLFARSISYLRVSLTDQCNLRCIYCTPKEIDEKMAFGELLSYEELLRVIGLAVELGIRKVRLTGGEPLVRRDVISFIQRLAAIPGLDDIRLTTNGVMLKKYAADLFAAGIRKLNISLDTLQRERFRRITGSVLFDQVWEGIVLAQDMGFSPVKLNMVVLRGINDDELVDFARLSQTHNLQIRFIEFMPIGKATIWEKEKYISSAEIKERIGQLGELEPVQTARMDGPARIYRFKQAEKSQGTIGFISPISHKFCDQCNRLRLTSEGKLRSCLLSDKETDLKMILRGGGSDDAVKAALARTVLDKPESHTLRETDGLNCHGQMSRIGG
ncbi:MAG: GTP 3',8-cyclase MoaA [Deltaproteobacteria bacterium]|nr:GTP 3',8-cyclase MoaA [Deltaproteobacteria bacterium]